MIYGNLKDLNEYLFLPSNVLESLQYAATNNLLNKDNGTYEYDGKRIYFNIIEFETLPEEEKFLEAHKKYIDIHLILRGKERIGINFVSNLEEDKYNEENDFLSLKGEPTGSVMLKENDFLICYPEDAHMPGIMVDKKEFIKKAVFKIML